MWHEARKHEKKLRGLMVDYRRRAERRREFYEKIRGDPASFLQIHGTQLKIHIDANISQAAENSLMPWMGNKDNLIDRFDVRAHLDYISPLCETNQTSQTQQTDVTPQLDRQINYERYRNLVQNEFLGLTESKYLQQIWLEERFGMNQTQKEQQQKLLTKKKLAEKKATIAYNYEDEDSSSYTVQHTKPNDSSESEESSDEDYDFDTSVNIDQLNNEMGHRINTIAHKFGMKNDDFVRYLDQDKTEAEKIKLAKELENEKSMFTGRKSRRERRALKEQRLLILRASNFDETTDRTVDDREHDDTHVQSSSDSEVSVDETKIEFITSFGGSSDDDKTTESQEKKQKNVVTKRKQKYKDILHEKIDSTPVVYGPTLPGEEINSSHNITSFNRNTSSRKRSYRYNHSSDSGNNRSRSRSYERKKHSIGETSKRYHRTRRTRSRSFDAKRSPQTRDTSFRRNNSKDYHRRSRSPRNSVRRRRSRSRNRSHIRSRSRDRSNQKTRLRSRSRSLMRKRSRSSSRSRRNDSKRVRRRSRSESISKIKRKRSESRGKRSRSRSQRSKSRSTYKSRTNRRSKSKSVDIKRIANKIITENVPKLKIEIIESSDQTNSDRHKLLHISPVHQIIVDEVQNNEDSSKQEIMQDVYTSKESKKLPSPPLKSYYRHDLCNTSSEDENEIIIEKEKVNSDEGSKKSALSSANTYGHKLPSNMTPQERLKKKMQALIDKQYKLDKKAELEKLEKQEQERVDREEELREMTYRLKYRRDAYHRCRNSRSVSRSRSRTSSSSSSSSASSSTSSSSSSPSSY